jgi:hypothetical protein
MHYSTILLINFLLVQARRQQSSKLRVRTCTPWATARNSCRRNSRIDLAAGGPCSAGDSPIDVDYSIFLSMLTGTVVCNDTAEWRALPNPAPKFPPPWADTDWAGKATNFGTTCKSQVEIIVLFNYEVISKKEWEKNLPFLLFHEIWHFHWCKAN